MSSRCVSPFSPCIYIACSTVSLAFSFTVCSFLSIIKSLSLISVSRALNCCRTFTFISSNSAFVSVALFSLCFF